MPMATHAGSTEHRSAVVILAGGRSARMGRDKAALLMDDTTTFLEHLVRLAAVIVGEGHVFISGSYPHLRTIRDLIPAHGPLSGIHAAAVQLRERYRRALFLPVDMPRLNEDLLRHLLAAEQSAYFRGHTLPCVLSLTEETAQAAEARLQSNDYSVHSFLASVGAAALPPTMSPGCWDNINTPEEYLSLRGPL